MSPTGEAHPALVVSETTRQLSLPVDERMHTCLPGTPLHGLLVEAHRQAATLMVRRRPAPERGHYCAFVSGMATTAAREAPADAGTMIRTLTHTPPPEATAAEEMLWALTAHVETDMRDLHAMAVVDGQRTYWLVRYVANDCYLQVRTWRGRAGTP